MRAIVIGAGPAGLASAACLKRVGASVRLFEKAAAVGARWRGHYRRLRLHTPRSRSGLPYLPMAETYSRYPSRTEVIDYLEDYTRRMDLAPEFGRSVTRVARDAAGIGWQVTHTAGTDGAEVVVFATGLSDRPNRPDWPGLGTFPGNVIHSASYQDPAPFAGRRVLVVGFGNSGGEIALDLAEAGIATDIVVRSAVNLLPKELFGVPIVSFGLLQKLFPYRLADAIAAPVLRLAMGDYARYGLRKSTLGPVTQVREEGRVPLIDTGALARIREGKIRVRPGIRSFDGSEARFADGSRDRFDAIILATGYRVDLRPMLGELSGVLDDKGRPLVSGGRTAQPGLYFCSYHATPNGQLRQINAESQSIAADVAKIAAE